MKEAVITGLFIIGLLSMFGAILAIDEGCGKSGLIITAICIAGIVVVAVMG